MRHGADPELTNREGWSPLHLAVDSGYQDVVVYLLSLSRRWRIPWRHQLSSSRNLIGPIPVMTHPPSPLLFFKFFLNFFFFCNHRETNLKVSLLELLFIILFIFWGVSACLCRCVRVCKCHVSTSVCVWVCVCVQMLHVIVEHCGTSWNIIVSFLCQNILKNVWLIFLFYLFIFICLCVCVFLGSNWLQLVRLRIRKHFE